MIITMKKAIVLLMAAVMTFHAMAYIGAAEGAESAAKDRMLVYSITPEDFGGFLDNPSMEFLAEHGMVTDSYAVSDKEGYLNIIITEGESVRAVDTYEGWYSRIGSEPAYAELIAFFTSKESLQGFLMENGMTGEIESAVLVNGYFARSIGVPLTAWIKTTQENYFVTIDVNVEPKPSDTEKYLYQLYTHSEYKEKYGFKDGVLKVKETDITEGNYFKLQNGGAYLPFRAVMEQLGAIIEWDSVRNAVLMDCNGKKYILETEPQLALSEEGEEYDLLLTPPGGQIVYSYEMIHDRIIMNHETMQECTALMGASVNVDFDNFLVTVE